MSFEAFEAEAVKTLTEQINSANVVADKVIHADNGAKLIAEVRESSEDETIKAFREWLDAANEEIVTRMKEVDAYIVAQNMVDTTPVDVPAETENFKTLDAQIKALLGGLKAITGDRYDSVVAALPERKSLPGVRKSGGTSGGTGVKRPRIASITCDYGDGKGAQDIFETKDGENNSNLTVLAKALSSHFKVKVEVKDLQADLFAAAKTDDLSSLDGAPVSFPHTVKLSDDKSAIVNLVVVPTKK